MGIVSEYLEVDDVTVIVWDGEVSGDEWQQFIREQAVDPRWPRGHRRLADVTTLDPSLLSAAHVDAVGALYEERVGNVARTRQAIVAAALAWDLARAFETHMARLGATLIVFDHVEDACNWLGIDPIATQQVLTRLRAGLRDI